MVTSAPHHEPAARRFLQIGETEYGKFRLELAVAADVGLVTAVKIALGSMMSTSLARLSAGPPYDIAVYRHDALDVDVFRVTSTSPLLARLKEAWEKRVLNAIADLPGISGEYFAEAIGGDQLDGSAPAATGCPAASAAPRSRRSK
jgi:predicted proteasome-type protease